MNQLPADAFIGIFAHPDDEWLAGWPVFQRQDVPLGVVFFVGDNRPGMGPGDPSWRPRLAEALADLDIRLLGCLECAPDFYRLPRAERQTWRTRLASLLAEARSTLDFAKAGLITHNPMGEYGHPDHIEVHRTVLDVCDGPVLVSDLCFGEPISERMRRLYYRGASYGPFHVDLRRWAIARQVYESSLRWTAQEWPGLDVARLYEL